jgi:hypothetical protein
MNDDQVLRIVIYAAVALFVLGVARYARKRPNRAKDHPDRVRLPKIIPVIGWLFVIVGGLMGLASLAASEGTDLLGMRIASVAIIGFGVFFLVMYRNWFIEGQAEQITHRTSLGRLQTIAYRDITEYRVIPVQGRQMLTVRATGGRKLQLNVAMFDVTPMADFLRLKAERGRDPLPAELAAR